MRLLKVLRHSYIAFVLPFVSCSPKIGGITESLSKHNLYEINRNVVAQQSDIDHKGNIYHAQLLYLKDEFRLDIFRVKASQLNHSPEIKDIPSDKMTLFYSSHPTGMAIESTREGAYVWIGNYATQYNTIRYDGAQTFSRIKYTSGISHMPFDADVEHFWFPHDGSFNVALDQKNDLLAVSFYYTSQDLKTISIDRNRSRRVRIYRLSEIMATPLTDVTLPTKWIRGGSGAPHPTSDTITVTQRLHDLSHLQPVAEIGTHTGGNNPERINSTAWQGFDIDNGIVWFAEGSGHSGAYITGYDFQGNIIHHRTLIKASMPCEEWETYKLCAHNMQCENEGVHVHKGYMYINLFCKRPDTGIRTNVLKFKLPQKQ